MKRTSIFLNLFLVSLTVVIPRIPPGDASYGDPILQILYVVLLLPVTAVLLNLILAKAGKNRWPHFTTYLVCIFGAVTAYTKWILKTDYTFLQTGSEAAFGFLFAVSIIVAALLFGILHLTGSGRLGASGCAAKRSLQ